MFANLTGWHLLIILAVVLLLFGAAKLPALAKSMGQSARILKAEIATDRAESAGRAGPLADPIARPSTDAAPALPTDATHEQ
jgi:sec-independent protein translocase protein TatA